MSKFLKFLVNLFLIFAILVAGAILIPPLVGVTTTVVDSAEMDTNLPLGSITYSSGVDVSELKSGDEVIKGQGQSSYAYIIVDGNYKTGTFTAKDAMNPEAETEEIALRGTVQRVAIMIPYIAYVLIAMHSMTGIAIIVLAVIFVIILYILSELWKKPEPEPDMDEEEEKAVSEITRQLSQADETEKKLGESVAEAYSEKQAEQETEEAAAESAEVSGEEVSGAEDAEHAEGNTKEIISDYLGTETEEAGAEGTGAEETETEEAGAEETGAEETETEEAGAEETGAEVTETEEAGAEETGAEEAGTEEAAAETADGNVDEAKEAGAKTAETETGNPDDAAGVSPETEPESGQAFEGAEEADNKEETDREQTSGDSASETDEGAQASDEIKIADISFDEFFGIDLANEIKQDQGSVNPVAPLTTAGEPVGETTVLDNDWNETPGQRAFIPVERPTLDEILEQAKLNGEQPKLEKNPETGVTLVDFSDYI